MNRQENIQYDDIAVSSRAAMNALSPAPPQEEDFSSLSLDVLLHHKNWKARKEGFERIRDNPMKLKTHILEKSKKIFTESNAAAQEALFEALGALVNVCDNNELEILTTGGGLKLVIEKGITGRPKAVQASFGFVLDLVGAAKQQEVFDILLPAFSHKTPKNRMAAAQLCSQIVTDYGVQGLPTKNILKSMQPLFNDANAQVRKEAVTLCCQCYKFIGAGIKGFLTDLRDVQLQELEKLFEDVTLGEIPPKNIRGQVNSTPIKPTTALTSLVNHGGTSNDIDDEIYENYDETIVLSKLPRNFYRITLDKTAKWQDRVAMVQDNLIPLLASPKIRLKDDYHELASTVRELLIDPQAPLMLIGFKCIQELARAMRTSFSPYARTYLTPLFEKLKDKKSSVIEHITTTLETLIKYKCISLDQCQDDIELSVQSRVPNQRLAIVNWLTRLTDKLDRNYFNRLIRSQNMLVRLLNDEKLEIRESSFTLVAKLMSIFGESNFQSLLSSLDDKQRTKIMTTINSTVNLQCTPTSSPAKKTQRIERREGSNSMKARSHSIGVFNTENSNLTNRSTRVQRTVSAMPRHSSPDIRKSHSMEDTVTLESTLPSKDEAFKRILNLINEDTTIIALLRSKEWSNRYNGVLKVRTMIDNWTEKNCTMYLDTIIIFLRVDPGWRESIFQVFQAMINVFQELVSRSTTVSPGASYAIIYGCTCRLTEPKNKQSVRDLITSLTKFQGLGFIIKHIIGSVISVKTPKLLQESNEFIIQLLQLFPASLIDSKSVVDYIKSNCLEQPSSALRSSGLALLIALRLHSGPIVDNLLNQISPAMRSAYEEGVASHNNNTSNNNNNTNKGFVSRSSIVSTHSEIHRAVSPVSPSRVQRSHSVTHSRMINQYNNNNNNNNNNSINSTTVAEDIPSNEEIRVGTSLTTHNNLSHSFHANEETVERIDVSQQLLQLAKQITNSQDWRIRLEAVKKIEELIYSCNKRIAPNGVTEILKALRSRFDEVNKNIVIDVLRTISILVESAGTIACRPGMKSILQGVLSMFGDQKASLREEANNVANLALDCLGLEPILQCMQKPLAAESHTCNQAALELIERGFQLEYENNNNSNNNNIPRNLLISLIPAVIKLCMSRILEVRSSAERVIGYFLPIVGDEAIIRAVKNLRPAEQQSVMSTIERQLQIYLYSGNEEDNRNNNNNNTFISTGAGNQVTLIPLISSRPPSSAPRSPRSPRNTSKDNMNLSHRSIEQPVPAQNLHLSLNTISRGSIQKENSITPASSVPVSSTPASTSASTIIAGNRVSKMHSRSEELLSIQEIMVGLRSASPSTAYNTCLEFMERLKTGEDCGTPEMIQVMVERLYENTKFLDVNLALGLIGCLKAIFENPRCAQRCHSSLLFRMLGMIFSCLLSESFSLQEAVIKALNNMTLKLLEGCPGNDVFSALMSRMTRYSATYIETSKKSDLKYIQVTVKCLMRLDFDSVSPDNVILCCHEYLLQHPPSAFRNLDDLSIRTVKTILQDLSRRCGAPLLSVADRLIGNQNLVTHFIRACLENSERAARVNNENASKVEVNNNNNNNNKQQILSSSTNSPSNQNASNRTRNIHVDPQVPPVIATNSINLQNNSHSNLNEEKSVASIFGRIRNHVTSNQGIEELYAYLKTHPKSSDFDQQFQRCSEAFRSYIKRKMERQLVEDVSKPASFVLPDILRSVP